MLCHLHFWMCLKWISFGRMVFPCILVRCYLVHWWCLSPVLVFGLDATWAASAAWRQERDEKPWKTSRPNTETNADPFVDSDERGRNIMPARITMSSKMYGVLNQDISLNILILDKLPQVKRIFRLWLVFFSYSDVWVRLRYPNTAYEFGVAATNPGGKQTPNYWGLAAWLHGPLQWLDGSIFWSFVRVWRCDTHELV